MIKKYFLVFTSLIFLLFAHNAFSGDSMGKIKLIVNDFYTDEPIAEAEILVTPCNYIGTTDSNGEAIIAEVVPYRNYQIDVEANGFINSAVGFVSVWADTETVAYAPMKQKSTITGQVTDGSSPLDNVVILLGAYEDHAGGQYFEVTQMTETAGGGNYALDNVDEGTYNLVVLLDNYLIEEAEINAEAGRDHLQNFTLTHKAGGSQATISMELKDFSLNPFQFPAVNGMRILLDASDSTGAEEFYWWKEEKPAGAVPVGNEYYFASGARYSFIIPATGHYLVSLFVVDENGMAISDRNTGTFDAIDVAPEAVPSVIPGPSELPYYNSAQVYPSTSGANFVPAEATIYLRGFAIDQNLLSPEEFNPDAPCFDIYGTKNGNFSASLFGYSWTLKDKDNTDLTTLLTPSSDAENVSFTIPSGYSIGDYFVASLTVTDDTALSSTPEEIVITISGSASETTCTGCHSEVATSYAATLHASAPGGAACQDCHGLGSEHIADPSNKILSSSNWPGVCGYCHIEFAELQKNNHTDPLSFGYYEPTEGRLVTCYKCHYTSGYTGAVESGIPFYEFSYTEDDFDDVPKDTPNVSCSVCHDPHSSSVENPYGLRTGSAGTACDTCHHEKWQNATLEGAGGEFENAYHYPGEDYSPYQGSNNPHRTDDKCVLCHMDTTVGATDTNGVYTIGGHTFRMRDFGDDEIPETVDDTLNMGACLSCHPGLADFDRNGVQTETKGLLTTLSNMLKGNNHDFLPPNQPGKCARCHKGGTVPFLNDPNEVLENAYTNYKLILNDRSWGIHNTGYIKKLLEDSIDSINGQGQVDISGKWEGTCVSSSSGSTYDTAADFTQTGNDVSGSITIILPFADMEGEIDGTVTGYSFTGTWLESTGDCPDPTQFTYEISDDLNTMTGELLADCPPYGGEITYQDFILERENPVTTTSSSSTSTTTTTVPTSDISVSPETIMRSRWIPLPSMLAIQGNGTNFEQFSSKPAYSPENALLFKLPALVLGPEIIWQMVFVSPTMLCEKGDQTVTVTVDEASDDFGIKLLPLILDEGGSLK